MQRNTFDLTLTGKGGIPQLKLLFGMTFSLYGKLIPGSILGDSSNHNLLNYTFFTTNSHSKAK